MYCTACGTRLTDDWRFCENCGAKIDRGTETTSETHLTAKNDYTVSESATGHDEELPKEMEAVQNDYSCREEIATEPRLTAKVDGFVSKSATDLMDYEIESDSIADEQLVSKEDYDAYEKILIESGFNAMIEKINEENNEWKNVIINIAIAGESGTGKSTLINSLRDMKAGDVGAAEIGCTETTKQPTAYPYRDNGNVKIWDLPGVGTPNFPQETYLKQIQIEQYDFIIVVSSTRFRGNDAWLAKEIYNHYPTQNLFFVRTKIDCDLDNYEKGHTQFYQKDRKEQIQLVKNECLKDLYKTGIPKSKIRVFLINSYETYTFDFGKLANMLLEESYGLKRDAIILVLSAVSNEIVINKIRVLKKRLRAASIAGAITANHSEHPMSTGAELDVLAAEGRFYQKQLGIDAHSIGVLARTFRKEEKEIYQQLNMRSHAILKTQKAFRVWYKTFNSPEWPVFGMILFKKFWEIGKYRHRCEMVLKELLKMCATETYTLHTNLVVWRDE